MANLQIERAFVHYPPTEEQRERCGTIRAAGRAFAVLVDEQCEDSREKSLALTKIEEAVFWANAALARYAR